jgi:hypothetical protein
MDLDSLWVSHVWQIEYEDEEQEQHAISNFAFWTSLTFQEIFQGTNFVGDFQLHLQL